MAKYEGKNYFSYTFFVLLFSVFAFWIFKHILPERLFPEDKVQNTNIIIDSLAIKAIAEHSADSLDIDTNAAETDSLPNQTKYLIPSGEFMEGISYLAGFYNKLHTLETSKTGKVRIAYFSDSMTDGDLIVQDIRRKFQEKYGGKGVGFVGITSLSASSRYSVSHKFSKNWKVRSFLKSSGSNRLLGVDGQVAFTEKNGKYSVEYRINNFPYSNALYNPVLFFGASDNDNAMVKISADKDSIITKNLIPINSLNLVRLTNGNPSKMKIEFENSDSIPFYGVSFDNGNGVYIDNLSMRGNSGLPLSLLNVNLMRAFNTSLNYNLIVLHYGANVLSTGSTSFGWYGQKMEAVVKHLKNCFPDADILIISTADKATRQNMEMKTDTSVEPLVNAQRSYARNTGSGFLNLYKLMGGNGSMAKWVDETPVLANKDYTHFNASGSQKIALLIFNEIEKGYEKFINNTNTEEPEIEINYNENQ